MRYFKNLKNEVYGYDETDDSQKPLIQEADKNGWKEVTGAWPPPISQKDSTLGEIAALEMTVTSRRMREAVLGTDNGWLDGVNKQIIDLRKTL
jgi:hypothetical protein